jgi:hypothetical protein
VSDCWLEIEYYVQACKGAAGSSPAALQLQRAHRQRGGHKPAGAQARHQAERPQRESRRQRDVALGGGVDDAPQRCCWQQPLQQTLISCAASYRSSHTVHGCGRRRSIMVLDMKELHCRVNHWLHTLLTASQQDALSAGWWSWC